MRSQLLLVHGGLATMGRRSRSEARVVAVIAQREREREEEVLDLLTNGATWRRSYVDDHTTALNRGSWWCSIGEIISGARRRDWSRTGCGG
jgi:hypothetical protein